MKNKIKDMEFFKRLKHESPDYFKKIQRAGVVISTIGGILLLFPATTAIGAALVTGGGVMTVIGKLPVEDPEKLKKEIENLKNDKL